MDFLNKKRENKIRERVVVEKEIEIGEMVKVKRNDEK